MDFDGAIIEQHSTDMDMTYPLSPSEIEEESTDHVRWQNSQTTCTALNRLIKSSANEPTVANEVSTSRGWQRQPSFDQIPGFSLLSTNDNNPQSSSQASSSSSRSVRSSYSRPRSSLARPRSPSIAPDVTNFDLPIPFLEKSNPSSFLDMLKGVSARLDENVGVKLGSGGVGGNANGRATKRLRAAASDLQIGRPKRSRASTVESTSGNPVRAVDKGKRRAIAGVDGRGSFANDDHGSMSELPFPLRPGVAQSKHAIYANVDDNMNRAGGAFLFQPQNDSGPPPPAKSLSQVKMPPPPAPLRKHPTHDPWFHNVPPTSAAATPTPCNAPVQSRSNVRPQSTAAAANIKPTKSESGPRYHPLLLEQQNKATSSSAVAPIPSSSTSKPPTYPPKPQAPVIATMTLPASKPNPNLKSKASPTDIIPSSMPKPSGSQSSRPPVLGMRRTHSVPYVGIATSLQTTGALPTRQKGFKPPLLSSSQAASSQAASGKATSSQQLQPQQQQQVKQPTSKPAYAYNHSDAGHVVNGSNGSTSSESLRGSSVSLSSGSSFTSRPDLSSSQSSDAASPLPKSAALPTASKAKAASAATAKKAPDSEVSDLPEPLDGDADSSFGDMMPFDPEALEATMKMYD